MELVKLVGAVREEEAAEKFLRESILKGFKKRLVVGLFESRGVNEISWGSE